MVGYTKLIINVDTSFGKNAATTTRKMKTKINIVNWTLYWKSRDVDRQVRCRKDMIDQGSDDVGMVVGIVVSRLSSPKLN